MTVLSIVSVLFATALMSFLGFSKPGQVAAEVEAENPRPRALPERWSNLLIALTVVFFFLLLAGLSYAGWFRVA